MYYAPECIPQEHRRPYSRSGVVPGQSGLDSAGVHAAYLHANDEGGARNGVMAAIQDFLTAHEGEYRWQALPGLYGYGILAHRTLEDRYPALRELLDTMRLSPFVTAHVQAVDIGQWHERVVLSRHAARQHQHLHGVQEELVTAKKTVASLEQWVRDLEAHAAKLQEHNARMDAELHRLHAYSQKVQADAQAVHSAYAQLTRSRSWRWTAPFRRWFR
jgi:hypothetical protein